MVEVKELIAAFKLGDYFYTSGLRYVLRLHGPVMNSNFPCARVYKILVYNLY